MEYNSPTSFDYPFIYHSPRRPAWLGVIGQIRDRGNCDCFFVDNTPTTFTIACDKPLPESVIDSFELKPVETEK